MSFTVAEAIAEARQRHPAFDERAVPRPVLLPWLSSYQRRLYSKAIEKDQDYLAQQMSVLFATGGTNDVGVVGAGSAGGLPITDGETVTYGDLPVGSLAALDFANAREVFGANAATSGTTLTTTLTVAARVVNEDVGFYYEVVAGTGFGTRRKIASNTDETWTFEDEVDIAADETTVFRIVDVDTAPDPTAGAVTTVPAVGQRLGYLVKIDAAGQPYLDLTQPLIAQYDVGIPLPPTYRLIGATVRRGTDGLPLPCDLSFYGQRHSGRSSWSAYEQNGKLFLVGTAAEWAGVSSLDVRYCPIPPAFTEAADVVFLTDQARDAVVACLAAFMGQRLYKKGIDADELSLLKEDAAEAEGQFLTSLLRPGQARRTYVSERFP